MDYIQLLRKEKEEELTGYFTRYKASKRSNVGNDPHLWFNSASASLFFFFLPLPLFFFLPQLSEPPKPFPYMAIYRKSHLGQGQLTQGSWLLSPEGNNSPKQASYLGLKEFHGPGEPDASLGEFGPRKFHKMTILPISLWFLFLDLTVNLSDPSILRCNWCRTIKSFLGRN